MHPAAEGSVATLFGQLVELPAGERAARLADLARRDPAAAGELRALLDADAAAGDFFGVGAFGGAAPPPSAAPAAPPSAPVPAAVGPYRLVRELGRGGMGAVWLAHDARLDRPVALKFLHGGPGGAAGAASSAGARARFLVEARAAAALDHPHVAAVHDVGEAGDGLLYIAMAYCAGGSLADRLAGGPLAPAEAVRVGAELAGALGAAHARGIVHRDVKPANVLFDAAGAVRLADFGVARLPGHDATLPGVVVGTAAYLAPEQVRGERAGPAADLWALGVTLHEMLAGRRPFAGASHAALLHAVLAADPEPLTAAVPAALAALVRALLAKRAADRPASAEEVAAALRAAGGTGAASPPAVAGPPGAGPADAGLGHAAGAESGRYAAAPLPAPLTTFVGRERELAEVARHLGAARLLTLTGPGGGGKTRLALAAAERAAERAAGPHAPNVVWVELAPVGEPAQVAGQIAAAAGVTERPGGSALDAVRAAIGAAPRLLVLDNCEHVVGACADAAERLLRGCPGLTVLATSREALGVPGEAVWAVPPLAAAEARRLFAERASAARAGHEAGAGGAAADPAVDEICRRLDGLPLAIELAAARARSLAPAQIAERLGDAFRLLTAGHRTALPRHRTLRAAMDWSHALLAEPERVLLRRLAVFAGDFALEAAEAVAAGPALGAADVLDTLAALVDKSLVQAAAAPAGGALRYRLLETVRQYGRERLAEAGELEALEAAHARHYLAAAEAAVPHIEGGMRGQDVLARLAADQHDLRAASTWALRAAERDPARWADTALRFTAALLWYWYGAGRWLRRGQFTEASAYAEAAVRAGAGCDPLLRARAHLVAGLCGAETGRADAGAHFTAARELARAHGEPVLALLAQVNLARALVMRGDVREARALAEEAWPVALALPVPMLHGFAAAFLGVTRLECGDLAGARAVAEYVVGAIPPEVHPVPAAHGRAMFGHIETLRGDLGAAGGHLRQALAMHLAAYDVHGLALDLDWLAELAAARGRPDGFARFAGAADALRERVGTARWRTEVAAHERAAAAARDTLGAGYDAHYRAGRALGDAELLRLADDLA